MKRNGVLVSLFCKLFSFYQHMEHTHKTHTPKTDTFFNFIVIVRTLSALKKK